MKFIAGRIWSKRFLCAFLLGVVAFVVGAGPKLEWVLSPRHAFIVLPATVVTEDVVQHASWAPNGAYLLVDTKPKTEPNFDDFLAQATKPVAPSGGISLLVWDREHKGVRKLWSTDDASIDVIDVVWLTDSSTAFVTMGARTTVQGKERAEYGVLSLNVANGQFTWVAGLDRLPQPPTIFVSPYRPVAVVAIDSHDVFDGYIQNYSPAPGALDFPQQGIAAGNRLPFDTFCSLGPTGDVKRRVSPSEAAQTGDNGVYLCDLVWSKDGSDWYVETLDRRRRNETALQYKARVGNKLTIQQLTDAGQLTPVSVELYQPPREKMAELTLNAKRVVAKNRKVSKNYNNLWISSPETTFHPDVLVTANSQSASFSPTEDAVLYIESGVAKVRPLQALSDEQKDDLFKALKAEALSNAKQAALGLLMYANDADDALPPSGSFDGVLPYMKNQDVMDAFNYTPPSNLLTTQIQNPAGTVIGYVDGPGGRAVAYVDGHCVWIPGP